MDKFAEYIDGVGGKETFSDQEMTDYTPFLMPLTFFLQRLDSGSLDHEGKLGSFTKRILDLVAELPQNAPTSLTASVILSTSNMTDFSNIINLNLHGLGITRIEEIGVCPNVRSLILSCNRIRQVEGLVPLLHLQALDLSFNLLEEITGLSGMSELQSLLLNNNQLSQLEDLIIIRRNSRCLRELDLRGNALCKEKNYRANALGNLSTLQILDGTSIDDAERTRVRTRSAKLTIDRIWASQATLLVTSMHDLEYGTYERANISTSADWTLQVETLNINYEGITKIANMEGLVNLRQLSFAHNVVTSADGLGGCTALEDLSLEDNRIRSCENLQHCRLLRKLDLSHNELRMMQSLAPLQNLTQLSIENNFISSLSVLAQLSALMELYVGNNQIKHLQEIDYLRHLPKLIIMDSSGNFICNSVDYRPYTLFRMRRLKVLDGSSVQIEEVAHAREKFSGKLSQEVLSTRLGHDSYTQVRLLEISSLKLRDLSILDELNFCNLSELVAENNQLSISSALSLPVQSPVIQFRSCRRNSTASEPS